MAASLKKPKVGPLGQHLTGVKLQSYKPDVGWKWWKWTFGVWRDVENHTVFGIDFGPLEIVWRYEGYAP